jgi:hypothetical protein
MDLHFQGRNWLSWLAGEHPVSCFLMSLLADYKFPWIFRCVELGPPHDNLLRIVRWKNQSIFIFTTLCILTNSGLLFANPLWQKGVMSWFLEVLVQNLLLPNFPWNRGCWGYPFCWCQFSMTFVKIWVLVHLN